MQVVQTCVVVAGVIFAVLQVRDIRTNRQLTAITNMFADFHQEVAYERRHRVLSGPTVDLQALSPQEYLDRMQVADFYQRIGYLCRAGLLDRRHVLEMYSGAIVRTWAALEPYVQMRRTREGLRGYSKDFEVLATAAADHERDARVEEH